MTYICERWIVFVDDNLRVPIEMNNNKQCDGVDHFNGNDTSSYEQKLPVFQFLWIESELCMNSNPNQ